MRASGLSRTYPSDPSRVNSTRVRCARAGRSGPNLRGSSCFPRCDLSVSSLSLLSRVLRQMVHVALAVAGTALGAQEQPSQAAQQITITGTLRQDVEKSYRKMV